jgi:acyl-CoA thioester hydrolase
MFELTKKVYYHDTDAGGVVYYANYLKYLEEARTEFFLDRNLEVKKLAQSGVWFVVRKVEIDYKLPARYADNLTISSEITKLKNASLEFTQTIKKAQEILVEAKTKMACVDNNFSPRVIPEDVHKKLA